MAYRVSKQRFGFLVEQALEELPESRDRPSPSHLKSLGLRKNSLLLGLYTGRPRTQRSVEDSGRMPDVIHIFQDSIERVCRDEQELVEQVRKTVLHEIGHHFGMSEEDLEELGYG